MSFPPHFEFFLERPTSIRLVPVQTFVRMKIAVWIEICEGFWLGLKSKGVFDDVWGSDELPTPHGIPCGLLGCPRPHPLCARGAWVFLSAVLLPFVQIVADFTHKVLTFEARRRLVL